MFTGDLISFSLAMISFLFAYGITVILTGAFQAWAALRMGDDVPANEGFLSFDPLVYIDPVGLVCMVLFHFGWGKQIPIFPFNYMGPHAGLKYIVARMARVLANFILCIMGVVIFVFMIKMYAGTNALHESIQTVSGQFSPVIKAISSILIAFIQLNAFLAVFMGMINICMLLVDFFVSDDIRAIHYKGLISFMLPLVILLTFRGLFTGVVASVLQFGMLVASKLIG